MTSAEQSSTPSPFHEGELEAQTRVGVAEKAASFGPRLIRDHMIDQHREFYAQLPFLLLGTVDQTGRPWASLVTGTPGFITTPDPYTLDVAANLLVDDPLHDTLTAETQIGLLGLQLETRRRNRMNGQVRSVAEDRFSIAVHQSFGNCPRFIQTRSLDPASGHSDPRPTGKADRFSAPVQSIVERADTLFIASAYTKNKDDVTHGADVSHRGGKPGFVRLEDDRTFVFPDFSGNNLFNTIGNLLVNPSAGFLFPDFNSGDLVYMTGRTEIIWDGADVDAFKGAERMVRFRADEIRHVEASLPMRFNFGEYAPNLKATGDWNTSPAAGDTP